MEGEILMSVSELGHVLLGDIMRFHIGSAGASYGSSRSAGTCIPERRLQIQKRESDDGTYCGVALLETCVGQMPLQVGRLLKLHGHPGSGQSTRKGGYGGVLPLFKRLGGRERWKVVATRGIEYIDGGKREGLARDEREAGRFEGDSIDRPGKGIAPSDGLVRLRGAEIYHTSQCLRWFCKGRAQASVSHSSGLVGGKTPLMEGDLRLEWPFATDKDLVQKWRFAWTVIVWMAVHSGCQPRDEKFDRGRGSTMPSCVTVN
ncbi:hypothetical protein B0H13DRAFT_1936361 [Mycena leptocephala]|nr:hypothetical protein B0H13DRAFT_1936361 [Mycena leptocephala]